MVLFSFVHGVLTESLLDAWGESTAWKAAKSTQALQVLYSFACSKVLASTP
jgi:hypothetical protein